MTYEVQAPVVFIIFKRADVTAKVFKRIREVKPKFLYVIADGPRDYVDGEDKQCEETRALTENIDWECEVIRDYSKINLGCRKRVISGIARAFEDHERVIIVEDDCYPEVSFFQFCDELLEKYSDKQEVMNIGGFNSLEQYQTGHSYFFGKYGDLWGWATWKDRWDSVDFELREWAEDKKAIDKVFPQFTDDEKKIFSYYFDYICEGYDTWDYQWDYYRYKRQGLSISPNKSLVTNIGFGENATNTLTFDHPLIDIPSFPMSFPMKHPEKIKANLEFDKLYYEKVVKEPVEKLTTNMIKRKTRGILKKVFGKKYFHLYILPFYNKMKSS